MNTMKCPLLVDKESLLSTGHFPLSPEDEGIPVLPALIQLVGVNEAILLQKLHWMLCDMATGCTTDRFKNDRWWVRSSYSEWQEMFACFSDYEVRRVLRHLRQEGYVLASVGSSEPLDRRLWYTIDYGRMNQALEAEEFGRGPKLHERFAEKRFRETQLNLTEENVAPSEESADTSDCRAAEVEHTSSHREVVLL